MDVTKLKTTLAQLHGELASSGKLDPELKTLLETLDKDIHETLQSGAKGEGESELTDRAREIESRFASEHPYLSAGLQELMEILGKMGI
ncbi:DUF4404 family protein [Aquabacterium sp.]|mgnify:CR=1 FL=1|uniref:DUF4404 family protein n=1 Tax=Aquabacterium sp. TaxID=1872578 RepID=UPI0035B4EA10